MTEPASPDPAGLSWHLERGLGRGLALLRRAAPEKAHAAVRQVCLHETRWDPAAEDRSHYLVKALAILSDPSLEEEVLDRWEREIPWRFRGPWSEVGLVLAALGRPRAIELAGAENEAEAWEEGPGETAQPEGLSDVREWLSAIRDDARLRVGGGLRVGRLARHEDMDLLYAALTDVSCEHLQEATAVAFNRVRDDRAREWFLDRLEPAGDDPRAYWWWQGLSGQRASDRARRAVLAALEEAEAANLQWTLRALLTNFDAREDPRRLAGAVSRALEIGAEDAVSIALEWMEVQWDGAYAATLIDVVRRSGFGRNRAAALDLAEQREVEVPVEDLLDLLEDAEIECRTRAVARLPRQVVSEHLIALGATEGEDPAFLAALGEVFGTE